MTNPFRLPTTVVPTRYEIALAPDLATFAYAGDETVTVTVREATAEVFVNAVDLEIVTVSAEDTNGRRVVGSASVDAEAERARLAFREPLAPGVWRLHLTFTGVLNDKLRGFYRSRYTDPGGAERVMAATQFEATDARRAFPCWDEPSLKAVFAVTLIIDQGLTAVSNTRVVGEFPGPVAGKKRVVFADSIIMPTYLVAFIVGHLEATDPVMVGATPVRIWCVPGKTPLARFGQEAAVFSLDFFERYYGMTYPGDKLDLLAIPDFASGAMENLGAITFRETLLLIDEKTATHNELERVADVVAHEVAHMWFGDLVTMAWWNGLWLNEAFATFMEMLAVDAWKPEWERWVTFGASRAAALAVDGLWSTRPIEFPVTAPREAEAMFDVLTYEKGAAVLRMLEQHLGAEEFRRGVRVYLERHKFGNADTRDLWEALGAADVMDGWIFSPGYPAVDVEESDGGLRLSQRRFTYLPRESAEPQSWKVPVTLRVSSSGSPRTRKLMLASVEARVEVTRPLDWVVANAGGHGFYRLRYSPPLLTKLEERLQTVATPIERFNIANDTWAMTIASHVALDRYLDLTIRFRDETDRNVWSVLIGSFGLLNRLVDSAERPILAALVRDRTVPALGRLGFEPAPGESELVGQLRGDLLRAVGILGDDAAVQERARALYRGDHSRIDPNVLSALIAINAFTGGPAEYEDFLARFHSARTPQEEQRYLYALGGFRQPELIRQTLERALNGEVRTQDAPYIIRGMLTGVYSRELTWAFVKEHWREMAAKYPASAYRRMWEGIVGLATPELEADVLAFFRETGIQLGGKTLDQYLEQLRIAVAFRGRVRLGGDRR